MRFRRLNSSRNSSTSEIIPNLNRLFATVIAVSPLRISNTTADLAAFPASASADVGVVVGADAVVEATADVGVGVGVGIGVGAGVGVGVDGDA